MGVHEGGWFKPYWLSPKQIPCELMNTLQMKYSVNIKTQSTEKCKMQIINEDECAEKQELNDI